MALDRRAFLESLGAGTAATVTLGALGLTLPGRAAAAPAGSAIGPTTGPAAGPQTPEERRLAALQMRQDMAQLAFDRPLAAHVDNGDEAAYPTRFANYSKGLPHDANGVVEPAAYDALLAAVASGSAADFEAIQMGLGRKLTNPQAGLAFDLEGPDAQHHSIPPAPAFASAEEAAEMGELYWMALTRDISFTEFETSRQAAAAGADLSSFSDFRGPKEGSQVTPGTLFRGVTPGDLAGPYISQFLLRDFAYGSLVISHRQETVPAGLDHLTDYDAWLFVQNGGLPGPERIEQQRRYIRNGRDLAHYVHVDALYEAYLNACLILLGMGAPVDSGNPYAGSGNQIGFGTFGGPHILSLVTEVATRALKAIWFQKWFVHRRLRPEEFGGRVHNHLAGTVGHPVHEDLLSSRALPEVRRRFGSWLLPTAFPEGCPTHPSYGSGHATVAGACVTILKAWFDESWVIPDPVVPNQAGTSLVRYSGHDAGSLTVGGELNKVAANIATGRNMAGIHWRSDFVESVILGESIAIGVLEEQKATYNEAGSFSLTRFDGTTITI